MPGVGPKPVKDWTDDDVEAAAQEIRERAERAGSAARVDCFRLVLQAREEERERVARSRLSISLDFFHEWVDWRARWRHRHAGEDDDVQIEVAVAGIPAAEDS